MAHRSQPAESESSPSAKGTPDKEKEDSEDGLDSLNDTLDDMIQASQLHPQHPRSLQVGVECSCVVTTQFVYLSIFLWLKEKGIKKHIICIICISSCIRPPLIDLSSGLLLFYLLSEQCLVAFFVVGFVFLSLTCLSLLKMLMVKLSDEI